MAKYDFDDEDGVWRTVGGRRIFIREGESLSSAMKKSGKFKSTKKGKSDYQAKQEEFEKNVDEMYNRFHGKTDKQIAEEIAKERGEKILTDKEQKEREVQFMKNLEKEVESKRSRYDIKVNGPDTDTIINDFEDKVVSRYDDTMTQDEKKKAIDSYVNKYKAQGEPMKNISAEDVKDVLYDNYRIEGRFIEDSPRQKETKSNANKYADYYKKEKLGAPSNYQKGDKIEFSDGYYNTIKGSIVREATDNEKRYQINSNLKGYVVRDNNGFEYIVADTRIKEVGGTNKAYKSAYEDYKKKHPNTKLTFGQFVDMSEGKK